MKTITDQITQLSYTFMIEGKAHDRIAALASIAVMTSYQDIGTKMNWSYLKKMTQVNLLAPYGTGTVTYNATTRVLTLAGGSWPSWTADGELLIDRNIYTVASVVDSTHLILTSDMSPVVDITTGVSYQLVKTTYVLPAEFIDILGIVDTQRMWSFSRVAPEEILANAQLWFTPSNSYLYTILGTSNGRMAIKFAPPPSAARTITILYQSMPRKPVLISRYTYGTVATTAGSATVALTPAAGAPALPTNIAGCVFRIGARRVPDGPFTENPPAEEHVIRSVSGNTITLIDSAMATYTAAMFSIEDPVDLELPSMHTYFDCMCEARYLRRHMADRLRVADAEAAEMNAFANARAADRRYKPQILAGAPWAGDMHEMMMGFVSNPGA